MSNLLITVLSIALVAVVALVGIYYGGAAFNDGQVRANANSLVTQAEQIIGGWNMYVLQNSGSYNGTTVSGLAANGKYISSEPKPPRNATASNSWIMIKLADNTIVDGLNGLALNLDSTDYANKVCLRISQMAGGTTATPKKLASASDTDRTPTSGRRFDCLFYGSGTTPVASDSKTIVYNVGAASSAGGGGSGGGGSPPAATATLSASPSSLTFATATNAASASQNITVTNSGTADATGITVSFTTGSNFTKSTTCSATLTAGGSCTVTVNSNSISSAGTYTDTLTIASANGGSPTVGVSATVTAAAACTATGAGDTSFNGGYTATGTSGGRPIYTNSNGRTIYFDGLANWFMTSTYGYSGGQYGVNTSASTCPLTTWTISSGVAPAPTTN